MRKTLSWIFASLGILALVETLISLIHSDQWWIQVLDFPRLLSLIAAGLSALGCIAFVRGRSRIGSLVVLALAAALQFWRLYPYVPFAPTEVAQADSLNAIDARSCFRALGLNVYQHNRNYPATIRMIDREQPDILLLMETDGPWVEALAPVLARSPHKLLRPIDNTYGLVFASKLPVRSAHIENITDQDTPTVYARLATRDGTPFDYVGLHPRPPVRGQDTDLRDRKIEHAALQVRVTAFLPWRWATSTTFPGRAPRSCSGRSAAISTHASGVAAIRASPRNTRPSVGRWTRCSCRPRSPSARCASSIM